MNKSSQIVRLVYASRATFKPFGNTNMNGGNVAQIDGNVAKILETARYENKKNQLVGALYYGHGYFFQCLEGSQISIDKLYAKLLLDPRHTDIKVLSTHAIDKVGFSSWEMKFAAIDQEVRVFLKNHNMPNFNPYKFDSTMTSTLVELLHNADEDVTNDNIKIILENNHPEDNNQFTYISIILLAIIIYTAYFYFK